MSDTTRSNSSQQQAIKQFLRKYQGKPRNAATLREVLADLGEYYDADRTYIFELSQTRDSASNTAEWCREGVTPEIGNLQNIPTQGMECWFEAFEEQGEFYITSLAEDCSPDSGTYRILAPQGIESLMAAPMTIEEEVAGFLGVDNPRRNTDGLMLLTIAAATCCSEIVSRQVIESARERSLREREERMRIIQCMGEIYSSVFYIDLKTNRFHELTSLAEVHRYIGATGDTRDRLRYFCEHMVVPEHREEMRAFVDLSTLDQRLRNTRIISRQYLSTIKLQQGLCREPDWTQCSFIAGDRDEEGRLQYVLFATQTIHESKVRELETQEKLKQANQELVGLLETEKQHTAIIGSLSSIYYALFFIDLDRNSMQEIVSLDSMHHVYRDGGDARKFLRRLMDTLVCQEQMPEMRLFTDFDTLDTRLGDRSIITQEFLTRNREWNRCVIIPVERDEGGKNHSLICGLRQIAAERERLETRDNIILALSMAYENIFTVNMNTGEAVCYRMGRDIRDRYGKQFALGSYQRNIREYADNEVVKSDRYLFERIGTVAQVDALLKDRQIYAFHYRTHQEGRVQYCRCQLARPNRGRREFVLAFKNVDEERRLELAQQKKLEDALTEVEKANLALQEEMNIVDALSREYHSLFKIDAESGSISLYRTDGIGMEHSTLGRLMDRGDYEQTLERYIQAFIVPEDQERIRQATSLKRLLKEVPEVGLYKLGYRRNMKGVIEFFEMTVVKTVNEDGRITFVMGIRDVDAEMRRQLRQTREMENQREIIDGLASEYYSVLLVNPRTDTITACRAEEDDGRAIAEHFRRHNGCWSKGIYSYAQEWVPQENRAEFLDMLSLERLRAGVEDYSLTYEKRTSEGNVYLQARVAFVPDKDDGFVAVVGTRNVDDLIQKERRQEMALQEAYNVAEAANRAKTDFLSSMSHDIRTPMNGIIGMTAIASAHIEDKARVQDSLQKISLASKHLLSLINEVLDMSKIESGKVQLLEEEFHLGDMIDNLISMTAAQIEEHHHTLKVNVTDVVHEAVVGDSLRLQKVFTNLLGNAVKFTPDGGHLRITVSEKPCNQPKLGCYEFIFEDDGIGMSEEFLDKVFEPFSRAADGRVSTIQGTGLGMPISRNIVRMMGGDIKVQSKLGVGSRFTVTIYLKLQDTQALELGKFAGLRVLVADDDPCSLDSCCSMLREMGMEAAGVTRGADAVEQVIDHHMRNQDYAACILDWKMPDMDGIDATRAIRRAVGGEVPIIILSAYDWSEIEREARAVGVNAFISKPMFRSRLAKTFLTLLDQEPVPEPAEPMAELEKLDLAGRRALLVEDNALNAEIAEEFLTMTGLTVEHVWDGTEAVDRIADVPDGYYSIVFMDIQMPRMNGYDATRAIRAMERNYCRQVPIVAMTANAFAEDVQAARTVGMDEHIGKPLDLAVLARTLKKWVR